MTRRTIKDEQGTAIATATTVRRRGIKGGRHTEWRVTMTATQETWMTDLFRTAEREARATAARTTA